MPKRPSISKSLRFSIFSRDAFTCRYCGRKSDEVKLVIDHVLAVANGGTNDPENLVTSCDPCNAGKGVKSVAPADDSELVRLSRMQKLREQEEVAQAAVDCAAAIKRFEQVVINVWCDATGRPTVDSKTIRTITRYAEEMGLEPVAKWISKAAIKCGYSDTRMGQYVSGIRRCVLAEKEDTDA